MKVLLILGYPTRETLIYKRIEEQIKLINPEVETLIISVVRRSWMDFIKDIISFSPDIVFTLMLTGNIDSKLMTVLKFCFGFRLISYCQEGAFVNDKNEEATTIFAGVSRHSSDLVDINIFWGKEAALTLGSILIQQKKLHGEEQIFFTGYPLYEDYFNSILTQPPTEPNKNHVSILNRYEGKPVFLFLSSFVGAWYDSRDKIVSADDLLLENDPNRKEKIKAFLREFNLFKNFRTKTINKLIEVSKLNNDCLIIFKMHPWEIAKGITSYEELKAYENIIVLDYDVKIPSIIKKCSMLFHIGSTSVIEGYLCKIPTCHVYDSQMVDFCDKNRSIYAKLYCDFFWPSTLSSDVDSLNTTIQDYKQNKIIFKDSHEINEILLKYFNIDLSESNLKYKPSYETAKLILSDFKSYPINADDPYLKIAVNNDELTFFLINLLVKEIEKNKQDDRHANLLRKILPFIENKTRKKLILNILENQNKNGLEQSIRKYILYASLIYYTRRLCQSSFRQIIQAIIRRIRRMIP